MSCGAGASSGFIAQSMRKAAKARGLECVIKAVADMELNNYVNEFDVLLIGPHIAYRLPELEKLTGDKNIKLAVIDQKKYAKLDGENVLNDALQLLQME